MYVGKLLKFSAAYYNNYYYTKPSIVRHLSVLTINKYNENVIVNDKQKPMLFNMQKRSVSDGVLVGIWKSLSASIPVACVQQILIKIHDTTGLPWWASIIFTTFLFRTIVTLPLSIYQAKIVARLENLKLEMSDIVKELKKETVVAIKQFNLTEADARLLYNRSMKKQWQNLIVRDNCHPMKTIIVLWGQIPLWIFQSIAIRNLVYMLPNPNLLQAKIIFTQLLIGGFGWIPNLIEVDHSYVLPVVLGLINLSIIEVQTLTRTQPTMRLHRIVTNIFRILSVAMVPIAATVPSCLCLYWISSSTYGLMQNLILLSPELRRTLKIPKTQTELQNPYSHLNQQIHEKVEKISNTLSSTISSMTSSKTKTGKK